MLKGVMDGSIDEAEIDFSAHKNLMMDLEAYKALKDEPYDRFDVDTWKQNTEDETKGSFNERIRLYGIMVGAGAIAETDYDPVYSLFHGQTEGMKDAWDKLQELEEETYARIILGQIPLDSFDEFVEKWYEEV